MARRRGPLSGPWNGLALGRRVGFANVVSDETIWTGFGLLILGGLTLGWQVWKARADAKLAKSAVQKLDEFSQSLKRILESFQQSVSTNQQFRQQELEMKKADKAWKRFRDVFDLLRE